MPSITGSVISELLILKGRYRTLTSMVAKSQVRKFVDRVSREFSPQRVILFGSHAKGAASGDSDVDLLVVMRTRKRPVQQALEIRQRISCPFPLDLLVRTPEDVKRRVDLHDFFITSILDEGEILYESSLV